MEQCFYCDQEYITWLNGQRICKDCLEDKTKYNKFLNKYQETKTDKLRKARWDND